MKKVVAVQRAMNHEPNPSSSPTLPRPEILAAYRAQATPTLLQRAERFARERARLVRAAGGRVDDLYPSELVQDALTDTWAGVLHWDPSRYSLLDHVLGVIRRRTWQDTRRARRYPHQSLTGLPSTVAHAESALAASVDDAANPAEVAAAAGHVAAALHAVVGDDEPAARVVSAWARGAIDRAEVLEETGLAIREYKAARARILERSQFLPSNLRDTCLALLAKRRSP